MNRLWISMVLMVSIATASCAQHVYDSTYFETNNDLFHGRLYLIQKYNTIHYENNDVNRSVNYLPHTVPGLGVGFTYNWLTVNLSYGFRFNGDESEKGDTKYLDLQIHSYAKKFIFDLFGQHYEGMYVAGDTDKDGNFYHRPDLQSRLLGGSFQYVTNNDRFSFRSSFLQTDWQKKSAGSVLVGFEVYLGRILADSTLLPQYSETTPEASGRREDRFWQFGPTIGYAYTVVIKKHFFLTGSFAESINYGRRVASGNVGEDTKSGFVTNPSYRLIAGFNTARWGVAVFYINNTVNIPGNLNGYDLATSSGTFRINYVYRFRTKGKIGELVDRI